MLFQRKYIFILLVVFLVFLQPEIYAQCAMCKQAAETSLKSNPNSMARSLNSGILYLMAVPYIMLGFIFRKQLVQLWKKMRGSKKFTPADQSPSEL
jgi:hypothetical protein